MGGVTPGREPQWQGGRTPVPMATGGRTPAWGAGGSTARSMSPTHIIFQQLTFPSTSLVRQRLHGPNPHVAPRRRDLQRWWSHTGLQRGRRWLSNRKPLRGRQPHRQPLWRLHSLRRCFGGRKPNPSLESHRHVLLLHTRPLFLSHARSRALLRPHTRSILPYSSRLKTV